MGRSFLGATWDRGARGSSCGAHQDRGGGSLCLFWGRPRWGDSPRRGAASAASCEEVGPGSAAGCGLSLLVRASRPSWDRGRGLGQLGPGTGVPRGAPHGCAKRWGLPSVVVSGCGVSGYLSVIVRPWSKLGLLSHHVICLSVKSFSEHSCF